MCSSINNYGYRLGHITVEQMASALKNDTRTQNCTLTYLADERKFTIENSKGLDTITIQQIFRNVQEKTTCFPFVLEKTDSSGNRQVSLCPFFSNRQPLSPIIKSPQKNEADKNL